MPRLLRGRSHKGGDDIQIDLVADHRDGIANAEFAPQDGASGVEADLLLAAHGGGSFRNAG